MTDDELMHEHAARFAELSEDIRSRAIAGLRARLTNDDKHWFREQVKDNPVRWWAQDGWHFYGGMNIRNMLRTEIGINDSELPSGNWDDYYIPCVEEAVAGPAYDDGKQW